MKFVLEMYVVRHKVIAVTKLKLHTLSFFMYL